MVNINNSRINRHYRGLSVLNFCLLKMCTYSNYRDLNPDKIHTVFNKVGDEQIIKVIASDSKLTLMTLKGNIFTVGADISSKLNYPINKQQQQIPFQRSRTKFRQNMMNCNKLSPYLKRNQYNHQNELYKTTTSNSTRYYGTNKTIKTNRTQSSHNSIPLKNNNFKTNKIQFHCQDYQIILRNNGQLYGKGNNKYGQLGLQQSIMIQKLTRILPGKKIKLFSTKNYHTICITDTNQIYYFGESRKFQSKTRIPIKLKIKSIKINNILDVICGINDTFLLLNDHRIYNINQEKLINLCVPKTSNTYLYRTGHLNLQIFYSLTILIHSYDPLYVHNIHSFLSNSNLSNNLILNQEQSYLLNSIQQEN